MGDIYDIFCPGICCNFHNNIISWKNTEVSLAESFQSSNPRVLTFSRKLDLEVGQCSVFTKYTCVLRVWKENKHDTTALLKDAMTDKLCGVCLGHKAKHHELAKQQHIM